MGGTVGGAGLVGVTGKALWERATGPDLHIPDVPEGQVRLERVWSAARGREVDLFTAVPADHGDGAGLPVCLVLHGATTRPADYRRVGFPQLLTAATRGGAMPFVLAGADGGVQRWEASGGDDPTLMLTDELPTWLTERGFDVSRQAAWGWSMGGYGVLRLAELRPDLLRAAAAFSPAVRPGDPVFAEIEALVGVPLGVWCGTGDPLIDTVRALVEAMPEPPEIASFDDGAHDMAYWTRQAEAAFRFIGRHL